MKIYGDLDIDGEIQNVTVDSLPEEAQPEESTTDEEPANEE